MNTDNPNLPNMSEVVESWSAPIKGYLIRKEIKDYVVCEYRKPVYFRGMVQNERDTFIHLKEQGQRMWKYYKLHATTDKFNIDDIIEIKRIKYRIIEKSQDQLHYGFTRYRLLQDYNE